MLVILISCPCYFIVKTVREYTKNMFFKSLWYKVQFLMEMLMTIIIISQEYLFAGNLENSDVQLICCYLVSINVTK